MPVFYMRSTVCNPSIPKKGAAHFENVFNLRNVKFGKSMERFITKNCNMLNGL